MVLMQRLNRIRTIRRDEDGASAIEFALVAPILVFSLLAMVDMGRAVFEKIAIDQSLRAGFEAAMIDPGKERVETIIADAAGPMFNVTFPADAQSSTVSGGADKSLRVTVNRFCACPSAVKTSVSCTVRCTPTTFPYAFYDLDAEKNFSGMLLPRFSLSSHLEVQVR